MPVEHRVKKLENGRAEFALKCVNEAKENIKSNSYRYKLPDYGSSVKKFPVLIKTNGLGNTLAFIVSKGKGKEPYNAYDLIYNQISNWLKNPDNDCKVLPDNENLLNFVISQDSGVYRQITSETLAFLSWLKRLAEGMIKEEQNE